MTLFEFLFGLWALGASFLLWLLFHGFKRFSIDIGKISLRHLGLFLFFSVTWPAMVVYAIWLRPGVMTDADLAEFKKKLGS